MKRMRYDLLVVEFHIVRHSLRNFKFQKNKTKKTHLRHAEESFYKNCITIEQHQYHLYQKTRKTDKFYALVSTYVSTNEDLKWSSPSKKSILEVNLKIGKIFEFITGKYKNVKRPWTLDLHSVLHCECKIMHNNKVNKGFYGTSSAVVTMVSSTSFLKGLNNIAL